MQLHFEEQLPCDVEGWRALPEETLFAPWSPVPLQCFTPHQGCEDEQSPVQNRLLGFWFSLEAEHLCVILCNSSTFRKQIPHPVMVKYSLSVCSSLSSLKCTQLFAFIFVNYCIICSRKMRCFIHCWFLTLIPWPFISPVVYPELLNGFAQICHFFSPAEVLAQAGVREPFQVEARCAPHHICIV